MRFNINLAARPYEDAGRFYRRWLPLLLSLAIITVIISAKAIATYREASATDREISKIDDRLASLEKLRRDANDTLARPENSGTRDAAQFLNEAFKLKSFSWTQVMADLEQLMPRGVQVVSIKPQLVNDQLQCTMQVATTHRDRVIELVRRMESSPRFPVAEIRNEKMDERGLVVEIAATYAPGRTP